MFTNRELTEEEQAINDAIDMHRDAMKDQGQVGFLGIAAYITAITLSLIGSDGSRAENTGTGLFIIAIILWLVYVALGFRTRKYRREARELMQPYWRKKALPFYQELVEMFADKPGVHLHLEEDGKIVVTDRREKSNG